MNGLAVYVKDETSFCTVFISALLDFFLAVTLFICSTEAFFPLVNSDHIVVSVSINFPSTWKEDAVFIPQLMTILVLIEMAFVIIWEMFHGKKSLKSILLLLNCVIIHIKHNIYIYIYNVYNIIYIIYNII